MLVMQHFLKDVKAIGTGFLHGLSNHAGAPPFDSSYGMWPNMSALTLPHPLSLGSHERRDCSTVSPSHWLSFCAFWFQCSWCSPTCRQCQSLLPRQKQLLKHHLLLDTFQDVTMERKKETNKTKKERETFCLTLMKRVCPGREALALSLFSWCGFAWLLLWLLTCCLPTSWLLLIVSADCLLSGSLGFCTTPVEVSSSCMSSVQTSTEDPNGWLSLSSIIHNGQGIWLCLIVTVQL